MSRGRGCGRGGSGTFLSFIHTYVCTRGDGRRTSVNCRGHTYMSDVSRTSPMAALDGFGWVVFFPSIFVSSRCSLLLFCLFFLSVVPLPLVLFYFFLLRASEPRGGGLWFFLPRAPLALPRESCRIYMRDFDLDLTGRPRFDLFRFPYESRGVLLCSVSARQGQSFVFLVFFCFLFSVFRGRG